MIDPHHPDDRSAMGLVGGQAGPSNYGNPATVDWLRCLSVDELVQVVRDPLRHPDDSCLAGTLLAVVGDPRLSGFPDLIDVPAGHAWIGTTPSGARSAVRAWAQVGVRPEWILKETPQFRMPIDGFKIARYCVTNQEYLAFVTATKRARTPSSWRLGIYPRHQSNHPVWSVELQDAEDYANWAADRFALPLRLPTEFEWEYAARGGTSEEYPWGPDFSPLSANTIERGLFSSSPVGAHPRGDSPFGLADMGGNVEELTCSTYAPYPSGVWVSDDLNSASRRSVITRGGCFSRFGDLARCARRHGPYPRDIYAIGFRLVSDSEQR